MITVTVSERDHAADLPHYNGRYKKRCPRCHSQFRGGGEHQWCAPCTRVVQQEQGEQRERQRVAEMESMMREKERNRRIAR
jgi:hypothetical protein